MSENSASSLTYEVRNVLLGLRAQIQRNGKLAFDRVDPPSARREAVRLELIERAESIVSELSEILNDLGIESLPEQESKRAQSSVVPAHRTKPSRSSKRLLDGPALHPPQLSEPVIDALRALGGTGHLNAIRERVGAQLGDSFTKADLEMMKSSNVARWQYNVSWTLTNLKNDGRVEHAGKHGCWRLTPKA